MHQHNNIFIDREWQQKHLRNAANRAGARYSPELNVELSISESFDAIGRTPAFYSKLREEHQELRKNCNRLSFEIDDDEISDLLTRFNRLVQKIINVTSTVTEYNSHKIPWKEFHDKASEAELIFRELLPLIDRAISAVDNDNPNLPQTQTHNSLTLFKNILIETSNSLHYFESQIHTTTSRASNDQVLILRGEAGSGKTHLLCHLLKSRANSEQPQPCVMSFGELFKSSRDPLKQIADQLGFCGNTDELLGQLNNAGEEYNCRALIIVDALNETSDRRYWLHNTQHLIQAVQNYEHIAVIVSIRTGFEPIILPDSFLDSHPVVEHIGYSDSLWNAVKTYFAFYSLPLPETPILIQEFGNPLFLTLYCLAFGRHYSDSSPKSVGKLHKMPSQRGHVGFTHILEAFVKQAADKIAVELDLPKGRGNTGKYLIWDTVIKPIAKLMAKEKRARITAKDALTILNEAHPAVESDLLIHLLESELVLVSVPVGASEDSDSEKVEYRFPFQKFSDHLICRYILEQIPTRGNNRRKLLLSAKRFFASDSPMGQMLQDPWFRGIAEALAIQCPQRLKGIELFQVAPYIVRQQVGIAGFIESIVWRDPSAFASDPRKINTFIRKHIRNNPYYSSKLLDALLTVTCIPDHPFNAEYLHRRLMRLSMASRDATWSILLEEQFESQGAIDRILAWGWTDQDHSHVSDEAITLYATTLCWTLASPNRMLRDRSTMTLVTLLTGRLSVIAKLLVKFERCNDLYVTERLYAVAYGCAVRSLKQDDELANIADWIFKKVFQNNKPPVHILFRDYARGIILLAEYRKVYSTPDKIALDPPYSSPAPRVNLSIEELSMRYFPHKDNVSAERLTGVEYIWNSVMYDYGGFPGDFGRYTINSGVSPWLDQKIDLKCIKAAKCFDSFIADLNDQQLQLLKSYVDAIQYDDRDFGQPTKIIIQPYGDEADEIVIPLPQWPSRDDSGKPNKDEARDFLTDSLDSCESDDFDNEIDMAILRAQSKRRKVQKFDTAKAQTWIFSRVMSLGWAPALHGDFDIRLGRSSLSRKDVKPERIGKKYQRIALFELLARISDNYMFDTDSSSLPVDCYRGAWQLYQRDLDPILNHKINVNTPKVSKINSKIFFDIRGLVKIDSLDWLRSNADLVPPETVIELSNSKKVKWLLLNGFIEWKAPVSKTDNNNDSSSRRTWYIINSYLVKSSDLTNLTTWLGKQEFDNRWMPEHHSFDNIFLGEFPWIDSFKHRTLSAKWDNLPTEQTERSLHTNRLTLTTDEYDNSNSFLSDENSAEDLVDRIKLPSTQLVDGMNISQHYFDGRFFDSNESLVAYDPKVFQKDIPSCLLLNKDFLLNYLRRTKQNIIWTIQGEEQIIGGPNASYSPGCLKMSGVYHLGEDDSLVGQLKTLFRSFDHLRRNRDGGSEEAD